MTGVRANYRQLVSDITFLANAAAASRRIAKNAHQAAITRNVLTQNLEAAPAQFADTAADLKRQIESRREEMGSRLYFLTFTKEN